MGEKSRTRKCLEGNSLDCDDESEVEPCVMGNCGAKWAEWGEFGECSQSCGAGTRTRTRLCEVVSHKGIFFVNLILLCYFSAISVAYFTLQELSF